MGFGLIDGPAGLVVFLIWLLLAIFIVRGLIRANRK